jgi:hypothetical protein
MEINEIELFESIRAKRSVIKGYNELADLAIFEEMILFIDSDKPRWREGFWGDFDFFVSLFLRVIENFKENDGSNFDSDFKEKDVKTHKAYKLAVKNLHSFITMGYDYTVNLFVIRNTNKAVNTLIEQGLLKKSGRNYNEKYKEIFLNLLEEEHKQQVFKKLYSSVVFS